MANILDYIKWRGDILFEQVPLNEVDSLILSFMSYVEFDDIVPNHPVGKKQGRWVKDEGESDYITVREASDIFWRKHTEKEVMKNHPLTYMATKVLREMAETKRFGALRLSHFIRETDEDEPKQFAAIQIRIDKRAYYLAFRGTDESIAGWVEDFNMVSVPEIPSARRAVEYMEEVMVRGRRRYYVGGHSKGGHLAFMAAINASPWCRRQIISVDNFDGPGVHEDIPDTKEYLEMLERMTSYVPEQSLFGLFMEHHEKMYIVKSKNIGVLQHDIMSWEVMGAEIVKAKNLSEQSVNTDRRLRNWLLTVEADKRNELIKIIYNIVSELEIRTVGDLFTFNPKKIFEMIKNIKGLTAEQKELAQEALKSLLKEFKG